MGRGLICDKKSGSELCWRGRSCIHELADCSGVGGKEMGGEKGEIIISGLDEWVHSGIFCE